MSHSNSNFSDFLRSCSINFTEFYFSSFWTVSDQNPVRFTSCWLLAGSWRGACWSAWQGPPCSASTKSWRMKKQELEQKRWDSMDFTCQSSTDQIRKMPLATANYLFVTGVCCSSWVSSQWSGRSFIKSVLGMWETCHWNEKYSSIVSRSRSSCSSLSRTSPTCSACESQSSWRILFQCWPCENSS